jgi:hypothetical protein
LMAKYIKTQNGAHDCKISNLFNQSRTYDSIKVTRLVEFSPIVQLFSSGTFLMKITEVVQVFALLLSVEKNCLLIFLNYGLG